MQLESKLGEAGGGLIFLDDAGKEGESGPDIWGCSAVLHDTSEKGVGHANIARREEAIGICGHRGEDLLRSWLHGRKEVSRQENGTED